MKNRNGIIILIIIVLAGLGVWWWQSSASDPAQEKLTEELSPEISVASARVKNISDERIEVISEVVLKNPYPIDFTARSLEYEVYIDSIRVIQDIYDEPLRVGSSDSTVIELPMEILAEPMGRVLEHFRKERIDSAFYELEATILLDVPIEGEERFTMRLSDSLPTIQLPEIELADINTNILSSDEGLDIVIRMTNPNHYPTEIRNGSFSFTIKEEMEVTGQLEDLVYIPAGATEEIAIHAEKEWGSLTQSALDFLFNQEDTEFVYRFYGILGSENEMLDDTELNLRVQGTLDEIADAAGL